MSSPSGPKRDLAVGELPPHAGAPGSKDPVQQLAAELQYAFNQLNRRLELYIKPTMIRIARERPTFAWFIPDSVTRFDGVDVIHEIAVNDTYFPARTLFDSLASLGAVMVEAYWHDKGRPITDGYKHVWWAHKMETIGLMPTASGDRGGARTGRKMSQYIIEGGLFQLACQELLEAGFLISWFSRHAAAMPAGMSSAPSSLEEPARTRDSAVATNTADTTVEPPGPNELAKAEALAVLRSNRPSEMPEERLRGAFDQIIWERKPAKVSQVKYSCKCETPNHVWGRQNLRLRCEVCGLPFDEDGSKREYGAKKASL